MFRLSRGAGLCLLLPLALLPNLALAQQTPDTSGDVIARIKDEGLNHSQVMQTLSYLIGCDRAAPDRFAEHEAGQ